MIAPGSWVTFVSPDEGHPTFTGKVEKIHVWTGIATIVYDHTYYDGSVEQRREYMHVKRLTETVEPQPCSEIEQPGMGKYAVVSSEGKRIWDAENADHAQEQHHDAFPDETIIAIYKTTTETRTN